MEPVTTAALITGGATLLGSGLQIGMNNHAAKVQARENRRIERLKIQFANEESGREMYRFNTELDENKRQFGRNLNFKKKELEQNESQFVRTNTLQKDQLDMNKKDLYARNKMSVRENMQNMLMKNHEMRLNLVKMKMGVANGRS